MLLHHSLGSLTPAEYPPGFRRWVSITRTASRLLLIAVGVLVLVIAAALAASLVEGH
jgi:hypothetical protein